MVRFAAIYGLLVAVLVVFFAATSPPREVLEDVYTPRFAVLAQPRSLHEAISGLRNQLQTPRGGHFLAETALGEAGAIWLSLVVALVVAFDFGRPRGPRHLDLLLLLLIPVCLFQSLGFLSTMFNRVYVPLMDFVFSTVFALSAALLARALWRAGRPLAAPWRPSLPRQPLVVLALLLLTLNVVTGLTRPPDDAGEFINLGTQRLRERGMLPYGDPMLHGTAGAAYGPLMYVAHLPFQWLFDPGTPNPASPDLPLANGPGAYRWPSTIATKVCTVVFHLLGVLSLWIVGRRLAGEHAAWGLVALYCGSAAVLGVGGDADMIMGMSFVSHLAPAAAVLAALALLPWPAWAGVMLAVATGLGFYPAFMAPAWVGHYWSDRRRLAAFLGGFAVTGALILAVVLLRSRAAPGQSVFSTFLVDTFGHHTDPLRYGSSPFGFWKQKGPIRAWLSSPLAGTSGFTTPTFLAFLALSLSTFFVARRRSVAALALASAAVALGASLIKIHATGTYLEWAYALLLVGHLAWPAATAADIPPPASG